MKLQRQYDSFKAFCHGMAVSSAQPRKTPGRAGGRAERSSFHQILINARYIKVSLTDGSFTLPTNEQFLKSVICGPERVWNSIRRLAEAFYDGTLPHRDWQDAVVKLASIKHSVRAGDWTNTIERVGKK